MLEGGTGALKALKTSKLSPNWLFPMSTPWLYLETALFSQPCSLAMDFLTLPIDVSLM